MWVYLDRRTKIPVKHCDHYRDYTKFKHYNIEASFTWAPHPYRRDKA